jgi:hypothetical protein
VEWEVEFTDEFGKWWDSLDEGEQDDVAAYVGMLRQYGPALPFPYSSGIQQSIYQNMRELRIQHAGRPYRVLYAFDLRRSAVLLIGGDKTGLGSRWYDKYVPIADRLYEQYLEEIKKEGLI